MNVLPLREGEFVSAVQSTRDFTEGKYLVFATRKGMIKKTEFKAYNTPIKADGIIAIKIRDDDELVEVRRTERRRRHHHGLALGPGGALQRRTRCGRWAATPSGVKGMNVSQKGNYVLAMDIARDDTELLVVTENGFGKRTRDRRLPGQGPRHDGRADDQADRQEGRRSPAR